MQMLSKSEDGREEEKKRERRVLVLEASVSNGYYDTWSRRRL